VPSLRETEQTLSTLWLDAKARQWLLSGKSGKRPPSLAGAPQEILDNVDQRGVKLYGGLISYGHQDVMESIFPYCCRLIGKQWEETVADYLLKFPPEHYNLNRLCKRFPEYLTTYGATFLKRYPYLSELADYEWIELEKLEDDRSITVYPHQSLASPDQIARLSPVVNPTVTVRCYSFDISSINERLESGGKPGKVKAEKSYVAVYRHPETHQAKFVDLGIAAAKIVEQAAAKPSTYQDLLPIAIEHSDYDDPQKAVLEYLELVEDLQELRIFVGSK
jgi:hypothetical protein